MSKSYKEIVTSLSKNLGSLRKDLPAMSGAFNELSKAAITDGVLAKKTKELIALAIGVAKQCDGCIGFHTQALVKLGATTEEVLEALAVSVYMGGGPALMYAADAYSAFQEFKQE